MPCRSLAGSCRYPDCTGRDIPIERSVLAFAITIPLVILRNVIGSVFPKGTVRRAAVGRMARAVGIPVPGELPPGHLHYQYWIENVEPFMFGPTIAALPGQRDPGLPLFSIVVSVYDGTLERYLFALVTSIKNQTYAHWELVVADATQQPQHHDMVARQVATDPRIRSVRVPRNEGISGNTNHAIDHVEGTHVVFVDHDDTLSPHALNELAVAITQHPGAVLIYSDEDKLSDDGDRRLTPHFKADWSPDLLHNVNYITHLTAVRADTLAEVGPLRPECDGAQDFDLLLRIVAHLGVPGPGDPRIVHVPKVLYHWRLAETSTAANFSVKSEALGAGVLALKEHFASTGRDAEVRAIADRPGFYRVRHVVPGDDRVVLVLVGITDTSAARARLSRLLHGTGTQRISRIITDADLGRCALPVERVSTVSDLLDSIEWRSLSSNESAVMVLSGNATPESTDWCDDLLGALLQPHVFAVAPRVVSPGRQVVDCGLVEVADAFVPLVLGTKSSDSVFGNFEWVRDVDALSGRGFLCRTDDLVAMVRREGTAVLNALATPKMICDSARASGRINLVWSHSTFVITGSSDPVTRFGNPQLERIGGTMMPTRGFDAGFGTGGAPTW